MNILLRQHYYVRVALRSIVLLSIAVMEPSATFGQTIVWTDANARRIQRKDVNGSVVQTIAQFSAPQQPLGIHYDPLALKLYYALYVPPDTLQRVNLDGSESENVSTPNEAFGFAINTDTRRLYWINPGTVLNRAELDGSGVVSHTYPSCCLFTIEAFGDELFFASGGAMAKGVWRADPDGSNEQFLHTTSQPMDLAYDLVESKLYIGTINAVDRMNLDGTGFEIIVDLQRHADQIVVDARGRKVYWATQSFKVIQRANLDGSNVEDFVTASDVGNPNFDILGLTIVYGSSTPHPNSGTGRSLSITVLPDTPAGPTGRTAIRLTMMNLQEPVPANVPENPPPDFSAYEAATCNAGGETNGCARWVGKPSTFAESQDIPAQGTFKASRLQCTPFYHDFASEGLIHVVGAEILPSSIYELQVLSQGCEGNESACTAVWWPITMTTRRFGDIAALYNPPSTTQQPDVTDLSQLVNKYKNVTGAPSKAIAQLQPNLPELNTDLSVSDIVQCVDAVKSFAYPFSGPCPCPSQAVCAQMECTGDAPCVASALPGLGSAALCVKACTGGANGGEPCLNHSHCPGGLCGPVLKCASGANAGLACTGDLDCPDGTCGIGYCRDRCGRCT